MAQSTSSHTAAIAGDHIALRHLGLHMDLTTDLPQLITFVRAVFREFVVEDGAGRSETARHLLALRAPEQLASLEIDGDRYHPVDESVVEAIVYQQLTDWLLSGCCDVVPVHAAALAIGDEGVVLAGSSGTGKSTLALALAQEGFRLLSDDVALIDLARMQVLPFHKAVGLADGESVPSEAVPIACLRMVGADRRKSFYGLPQGMLADAPARLTHVLFIGKEQPVSDLAIVLANSPQDASAPPAAVMSERVEYTDANHIRFVRVRVGDDVSGLLAKCRQCGLLPLGIEPVHSRAPRFEAAPRAVSLEPDVALLRLWRSLKPGALACCDDSAQLFWRLAGVANDVPSWTIEIGPVVKTAQLVTDIVGGAE